MAIMTYDMEVCRMYVAIMSYVMIATFYIEPHGRKTYDMIAMCLDPNSMSVRHIVKTRHTV